MLGALLIIGNALPLGFRRNPIYQNSLNTLSLIAFSLAIIFNFMDVVYYRFTLKRMTFDIFQYIESNGGFLDVAPGFLIDFWYISLLAILSIILMVFLFTRIRLNRKIEKTGWRFYSWSGFLFIISIAFTILGIRGGAQLKPINIVDAGLNAPARLSPLVLNTPFTIIKSYGQLGFELKNDFTEDELEKVFNPIQSYSKLDGVPADIDNIIILILESFSAEHFGYFTHQKTFTPFLDSLFEQSLVFKGIANGKRSIEGIPAILSSLPTLSDESFLNGPYAANQIEGLADILNHKKYQTAFFHGGKNGTMSFDAYAYASGFQKYYGMNEYPNKSDYDGHWGIWDELYLQYFANELDSFNKPFLAALFTLSSHHPYQVPEKYMESLPEGKLPIQKAVAYTDLALKNFFKTAQTKEWYQHTLFVITADHTSEGSEAAYQNAYGQFSIPIAFFAPSDSLMKTRSAQIPVQQTDIFPSILQYLGISDSVLCFGNSVFEYTPHPFAINHYNHQVQIFDSSYLLQVQNEQAKSLYLYLSDSLLKNNLMPKNNANDLLMLQKAFIQQYNNRMIHNNLKAKPHD
jgi:phosphoglycerol transferase MdoB-like AlkP superfamily enzyme